MATTSSAISWVVSAVTCSTPALTTIAWSRSGTSGVGWYLTASSVCWILVTEAWPGASCWIVALSLVTIFLALTVACSPTGWTVLSVASWISWVTAALSLSTVILATPGFAVSVIGCTDSSLLSSVSSCTMIALDFGVFVLEYSIVPSSVWTVTDDAISDWILVTEATSESGSTCSNICWPVAVSIVFAWAASSFSVPRVRFAFSFLGLGLGASDTISSLVLVVCTSPDSGDSGLTRAFSFPMVSACAATRASPTVCVVVEGSCSVTSSCLTTAFFFMDFVSSAWKRAPDDVVSTVLVLVVSSSSCLIRALPISPSDSFLLTTFSPATSTDLTCPVMGASRITVALSVSGL